MLTVLIGGGSNERLAVRRKATGGILLEEIESDRTSADELALLAGTPTLTGEAHAFLVRGVLSASSRVETENEGDNATREEGTEDSDKEEKENMRDSFLELAQGLSESPHFFIFEEDKVPVKTIERLRKAGATVHAFEKEKKAEPFNVFAMADALGRGDRKKLWLLLVRAFRQGVAPENVAGILAWKARATLASARTSTEREKWGALSRDLVVMYHESHRGGGELALLLERFVLTV